MAMSTQQGWIVPHERERYADREAPSASRWRGTGKGIRLLMRFEHNGSRSRRDFAGDEHISRRPLFIQSASDIMRRIEAFENPRSNRQCEK